MGGRPKEHEVNVLVTGVAGFLGSHLADKLIAAGHRVVGLDDLSGGFRQNVPESVEFVVGSVCDRGTVERLFEKHRIDAVYHLAAYAAEGLSHFVKHFNYRNNLLGSVNLLNSSIRHGARVFCFASSIAVYGSAQCPMTEDMTPAPEDPYGIAKYAVEMELAATRRVFGLPYVVFRPHNVYGERQNVSDPYRNVVGIFLRQALRDQPMTVFGDGSQTRAFSHVDEVSVVMARCVDTPQHWNQVFNLGADTPYKVRELAETVASVLGKSPRIEFLPSRMEVKHAYADHSKVSAAFGRPEHVPLAEGVRRMADWVTAHGIPSGTRSPRIEVDRGMPEIWLSE
jgi:UDP-glucose 4-epimerase